ncbi:hypothetical protein [Nonomuraea sp. 10N515B]|uniref:hypothetical protein n=1 Tax=Nonomuraea sp. 10N515B TaxID=3457422 RepID=UPI003FCEB687
MMRSLFTQLDPGSTALTGQLAATVPVLVTLRTGEPCPDALPCSSRDAAVIPGRVCGRPGLA